MRFGGTVGMEQLLCELQELPSDALDDVGNAITESVEACVRQLQTLSGPPSDGDMAAMLQDHPYALDVCRLFMGLSQDRASQTIGTQLAGKAQQWAALRRRSQRNPVEMAKALVALGVPETIRAHLARDWGPADLLVDRLLQGRGSAITGQKRGRVLESLVAEQLERHGVPFERGGNFVGAAGREAKCDFSVPERNQPSVVIEAKGYGSTGSKQTDALGDVLKIIEALDRHMHFFVVTDGLGWRQRTSDLAKLVEHHQQGHIDMIYTLARIDLLGDHVSAIHGSDSSR